MRTLVVSDLHLGRAEGSDLLRRADLRAPLLEALAGVDRFVILGDGLELREAAHRDAMDIAAPFFADVGEALGPEKELLMLAGNHDHGIAAGWIDARLQSEPSGFLTLEQRFQPDATGPLGRRLAEAARPAQLQFAYPGIWLRDDVYAIHGHYSDVHATVPTFERLAAGSMARYVARLPERGATADDYEAVLSPLYAWLHALTQRADNTVVAAGGSASAGTYAKLTAKDRHKRRQTLALALGYRAAVFGLNRAGLGPLEASLTPSALRRGYLRGIREVIERLDIRAAHVIWGHSHRSGPWPSDDQSEWVAGTGARILNTGSWVYQPHFLSPEPNGSPYWPGTAVIVEDTGPPRLVRLLGERGHETLRPRDRA
ncbi:metallophosphoesterase [Solirubrobacter ginsenosidimutans]|uniref:Metallophosphoesterase n=1 Tax=Solirubrobacter ginsenosidimutans TaxID=490573 RepID=A0A9X3MYL0_9ACTN|nr:metallophosphoesterase [Solirubrobacter ginsenosidimutans]MDA0165154.1 metallophosphoesterase [Solirubrobacter ginsenosidimutans]